MKKFRLFLLALFYFYSFILQCFSQTLDTRTVNYIDSLVSSNYPPGSPGMSLLIAENGIPLYKKAFGMADLELKVKLTPDNVFGIGSMTKQFTAVGILQLVNKGKINLNDDIKKYLPDYNTHGKVITVENCLTHTSGIPSFSELKNFSTIYQKNMSKSEIIKFFQDDSLLFDPGSDFSYSNSGFIILGLIIEKVSGLAYEEYVQKNIFDKLQMKHSYFGSFANIIPMRACGYDGADSTNFTNASYFDWSWPFSAGNILSTSGDMLLWNDALNTDKLVPQSVLQMAWTSYTTTKGMRTNYGYGWNITPLGNYTLIKHGGAINGYLSDALRIPEKSLYIVALTNFTGKSPDNVTGKIVVKLLNINTENPKVISLDKSLLSEYPGTFEVHRDGARILTNYSSDKQYRYITLEGDSLYLQRTGGSKLSIYAYEKDKFFAKNSTKRFDFVRDDKGKVIAVDVYDYPINFGPHDICYKADVAIPDAKKEIEVSIDVLKKYEGEFELQPGFNLKMFVQNGKLFTQATGQETVQLYPESENKFFMKIVDAQVEFIPDSDGTVNKLILTQGQKYECKRIK